MAFSDQQLLDSLSRTPFVDSAESALILGEPHATVHRALTVLLADGLAGRVSHGTAHLPSSQRYHLTAHGIRETARVLGFATASDFVRAYPASSEWLTLLIRRMDAVAVKGGEILGQVVSKFRGNVRLSVQQKCHSVKPRWYQMMTFRKPRGIVALADPQRPCIS